MLNAFYEQLRGHLTHSAQWLADGGQAWRVIGGAGDIVEADDGDILRAAQTGIDDGTNGADGGDIVETKDRSEVAARGQEIADDGISKLGRPGVCPDVDA